MNDAVQKLQKFLQENNIVLTLSKPVIKFVENGAILIENSTLLVNYGTIAPTVDPNPQQVQETPQVAVPAEPSPMLTNSDLNPQTQTQPVEGVTNGS